MNTCKTLCLALQGFVKIKRRHLFFPTVENKYYTKIIIITKRSVTKKHENFLDLHKHLNVKRHVLAQGPCGPHVISILAVPTGSTDCGTDSVHSSRCHSAGGWVHEYRSIYRTNWTEAVNATRQSLLHPANHAVFPKCKNRRGLLHGSFTGFVYSHCHVARILVVYILNEPA